MRTVIIAFADQNLAGKIRALLKRRGLPVRGICHTGSQVLQMAIECDEGGVVVCTLGFTDMMAREVMSLLPDTFDMLVLITPRQQGLIGGPGTYTLTMPADGDMILDQVRQLLDTRQISASMAGFPNPLYPASGQDRNAEERKIIEQAKYLLMNRKQVSEADAHRYLQKKSMETGIRMVELARRVILIE